MNAELIVQEHLKHRQLKQQIQDAKYATTEAKKKRVYEKNIIRLKIAIKNANAVLRSVLKESSTIRQIFEDGDFSNVHFDKAIGESHFGCDGYHIFIQNRPSLIIPILPGSGEGTRAIRIETSKDAHKWPMWALEQLEKVVYDLESLAKEELVRRILAIRDTYPHWLK